MNSRGALRTLRETDILTGIYHIINFCGRLKKEAHPA